MSTTDCEVTSLTSSSPGRSPASERSIYYVHSPSGDSNNSEKTAPSTHSTPALMSPMGSSTYSAPALMIPMASSSHSTPALMSPMASPSHSHSSVERRSQDSSSTGFSTSMKPRGSCRKSMAFDRDGRKGKAEAAAIGRRLRNGDDHFAAIEEEGLLEGDEEDKGLHRRRYCIAFLVGFASLFSVFVLILWGVSRSQKPEIVMKSIKFENFFIQAGIDASLVPTDMVTLNSTVRLTFRNTGTFFGIHVSSAPLDLAYNKLVLASGSMDTFYQSRKSQKIVDVVVLGNQVPLYGGGERMTVVPAGKRTYPPIPLRLSFMVKVKAFVLGRLVKHKFHIEAQCSVIMDHANLSSSLSLKNSCQYNN